MLSHRMKNEFDGWHKKPVKTGWVRQLTRLNEFRMATPEFIRGLPALRCLLSLQPGAHLGQGLPPLKGNRMAGGKLLGQLHRLGQ